MLKQKIKLEAHFLKNSCIALLYIDYRITVKYIIDLFCIYNIYIYIYIYTHIHIYTYVYIYIYIYIYIYVVKKVECKKIINILTTSFQQISLSQQCFANLFKLNYKNMKLLLVLLKYKVIKQSCFINV